jgi:hypothetical protein
MRASSDLASSFSRTACGQYVLRCHIHLGLLRLFVVQANAGQPWTLHLPDRPQQFVGHGIRRNPLRMDVAKRLRFATLRLLVELRMQASRSYCGSL